MNGTRLSVCVPGATSQVMVDAARLAESFNLDVWAGDPRSHDRGDNADDSYVMAAAAAVAAVTSHVRIGVFLTLSGSAEPLRLAEDVGVVDQAARGRLELGLVVPAETSDSALASWEASARAMLNAWHDWPTTTGRSVATTPGPAQPWVPRLVAGPPDVAAAVADRLRGGAVVFGSDLDSIRPAGAGADDDGAGTVARRTVLAVRPPAAVRDWLAPDPLGAVMSLRAAVDRASAHGVMVMLDGDGSHRLVDDMEALGIVVGTGLRCSPHHAPYLVPDAWRWLTERRDLHHAPS
jgi:alkanesulfonate monooxygenase SsuD/methylene tetrahydromethanopterin reductase-like flavin-dependent oxidoreductase (luciferase family)